MSGDAVESQTWPSTPDTPRLVSVVAVGTAVLICEDCGVIWYSPAVAASEIPEAVEEHQERHRAGEED